jgi:hypothetical protein
VKVGANTRRIDAAATPISPREAEAYLVHEDGFLRVPVLVLGDLIVRGYTEEIYREVLGASGDRGAPNDHQGDRALDISRRLED